MDLRFTKMHGCGNDFVVIDDRALEWDLDEDAVRMLCDRHFGIGADGIILVRPATVPGADFLMYYINSDGSLAEMCGNGVRVFAKYLVDRGLVTGDEFTVQTLGGLKAMTITRDEGGRMLAARVNMGEPVLEPALIPTTLAGECADGAVMDCPIDTELGEVRVTCVSMGNPHAIIWVDDVDTAPVHILGPLVENHPAFPRRTNVEFAQAFPREDRVRLRVWERGCGETLACGTGACATAVAAILSCRSGRTCTIELPGGDLVIGWSPDGDVFMTGPAEEVFEGVWSIPDEE